MNNIECYLLSIDVIKNMLNLGIINHEDYIKAEQFLANKYCIILTLYIVIMT